ncbi:hypothetical protein QQ045_020943 [Rhodiola kirilowii]
MSTSSSPGPDGFTGIFFVSCWDIIKEDMQAVVQAFFEGVQLPKIISSTSIVLIPKIPKANNFDQVRPISQCNFIHKVLSRILNSRLTIILKKVISPELSIFWKGDISMMVLGWPVIWFAILMSKALSRRCIQPLTIFCERFYSKNTNFIEGSFPTKYLGAPLFPGRTRISYFKYLEDSIRSKIMGWSKNFLNISGRATLISSVLSSLDIHTLSIIPVLKTCIESMEMLFANFIWDGKHHWVSWENMFVFPKMKGD